MVLLFAKRRRGRPLFVSLRTQIQLSGGPVPAYHQMRCSTEHGSGVSRGSHNLPTWQGLYDESSDVNGGYAVVRDLRVFDGARVYATKSVERTKPLYFVGRTFGVASESTRFELRHVPE